MNDSVLLTVLLVAALAASVAALVVGVLALRRSQADHARRTSARRRAADLPTDVEGLRGEVQALRTEAAQALRHLAVVRYDAFGDMGGHLSWSMALLDDGGDGVVLTSIHGRSEARTYAKNVMGWSSEQPLSPEEEEAVRYAKTAS
jgi:outer membrane murein-binding lipoprotein Lpp